MQLELLDEKHLSSLMDFELENRRYFETFIQSRGHDFYRRSVILEHIRDLMMDYEVGDKLSSLVIKNNQVIARANIKSIDTKAATAEVGYRVAQDVSGQGVASFALKGLIELAKQQLKLKSLTAWVLSNNPASAKVLEKQGFVKQQTIQNYICFEGSYLDCSKYGLSLY